MRECVCDNCGMEFEVERLDITKEALKDGPVEVVSFTCPKCDERYIIAVRDDYSAQLQKEFQKVKYAYKNSYDPKNEEAMRVAKREMDFRKRQLCSYMHKLNKKYLKELRKRG